MALAITMNMCAEEMPEGYYDAIDGKKDKDLKSAISAVIRSHTAIPYGSGKGNTWEVFYYSDSGVAADAILNIVLPKAGGGEPRTMPTKTATI